MAIQTTLVVLSPPHILIVFSAGKNKIARVLLHVLKLHVYVEPN